MKLSVVIPAFKEPYLQNTVDSFLDNSELGGDVEVIVVLDGPWLSTPIKDDSRVIVVHRTETGGMRAAINSGISVATGVYLMKVDAHCAFAPGFDRMMVESCDDNWLVIPRRYSLDDIEWSANTRKPARDYHYLLYPSPYMTPHHYYVDSDKEIDDTMSFQGSCWLANREQFMEKVGYLDSRYGTFAAEQLEVGLNYWFKGGEVKINKKTWYAHLFKMPRHYRTGMYALKSRANGKDWLWATNYWLSYERFPELVEKFWPVPTWPEERDKWILRKA